MEVTIERYSGRKPERSRQGLQRSRWVAVEEGGAMTTRPR